LAHIGISVVDPDPDQFGSYFGEVMVLERAVEVLGAISSLGVTVESKLWQNSPDLRT
jgi:hypothetical protein